MQGPTSFYNSPGQYYSSDITEDKRKSTQKHKQC